MKTMNIKIKNIDAANTLAAKAELVNGEVLLSRGKFCVDGKSLLGVAAINVAAGVTVEYPDDATEFEQYISQFKQG